MPKMSHRKSIKQGLIALLLTISAAFASLPWWGGSLLERELNRQLQTLLPEFHSVEISLGYPGLSGVQIPSMVIKMASSELSFKSIKLDYGLKEFDIESLVVRLSSQKAAQLSIPTIARLPEINLAQWLESLDISQVAIKQIEIKSAGTSEPTTWRLEQLKLKKVAATAINFSVELIPSSADQAIRFDGQVLSEQFGKRASESRLMLRIDQEPVIEALYLSGAKGHQLQLSLQTLPVIRLTPRLANLTTEFGIDQPGALTVTVRDLESTGISTSLELVSQYNGRGYLSKPVGIRLHAEAESFALPLKFNLLGRIYSDQDMQIMHGNQIVNTSQPELLVGANLTFNTSDKFPVEAVLKDTNWAFKAETVTLPESQQGISPITAKQFNLKGKLPAPLDLSQLLFSAQTTTELFAKQVAKVQITTEKVSLEKSISGLVYSGKLNAELSIATKAQPEISGELALSELAGDRWQPSGAEKISLILKSVTPALSAGQLTLYLEDKLGELNGQFYQQISAALDAQAIAGRLVGNGGVKLNNKTLNVTKFDYQVRSGIIDAQFGDDSLDKSSVDFLLSQLPTKSLKQLSFMDGHIIHRGHLVYNPAKVQPLSIDHEFKFKQVDLSFQENRVYNLELEAKLHKADAQQATAGLSSPQISLVSGIEINHLKAQINAQSVDDFTINQLSAEVFEGELSSHQLAIISGDLKPTHIKLSKLDLTQLIFFLDMENLYAEGEIDVDVPIHSEGKKFIVKQATFKSRKPGIIKYDNGVSLGNDDNLALKALKDFHYKQLDGEIDYDKAGNYRLKIHLLGANPAVYDGYPVDFTFNINGHLPGLFRSLFLSGNFEQSVLESISADRKK